METTVRLFAALRERAGSGTLAIELPESATVADAIVALSRHPALGNVVANGCVMAVNREYAEPGTPLRAGDELALIPPVSGGAP
jgi:MoaE-MoaD fusion protein